MISQLNHWIEIGGTATDAVLLLRVLQLRLHRTYLFITLFCVLGLFFDGIMLWLGSESREFARVFVYSRFLYTFVFPAAAYDVWDEAKIQVSRIRKFAAFRLLSSLVLAAVLGLIILSVAGGDEAGQNAVFSTFGIILWAASSTASLAFLWSMHRIARAQKIELPSNTSVWLLFFQLTFAAEVVSCFLVIVNEQFNTFVSTTIDVSLGLYGAFITLWCVWKLRPLPSDVSAPENASL